MITVPIPGNDDAIRAVSMITSALVDVMAEARSQVPVREAKSDAEGYSTYSSDMGEADEEETRRRRPRRKRRPKPEAIAARLKTDEPEVAGATVGGPEGDAPADEAPPEGEKE